MSSYYIFDKEKSGGFSSPATNKLDMGKYEIVNMKTYPETDASATSKKYVNDEDKKLLDLAGTRQMLDDLDLGNNACIGISLINASNSAVPRGYIDDHFVMRKSESTMSAHLNMANYSIKNLPDPSLSQSPATKNYVDTELGKLHTPVCYNYMNTYPELRVNSWKYPQAAAFDKPDVWMYIPSLSDKSYFELQYHIFDNDNSFPSGDMNVEYRLQVFQGSSLKSWSFFDGNIKNYRVPGENMVYFGQKYFFKNFPSSSYKQFTLARLSVKRKFSGTFGNESRVGFSVVS